MASDTNARTLSAFLDYLRVERGSAKLTIAAYTSDLAQFAEFLEKRHQILRGARREDVREYIQELFSNHSTAARSEGSSPPSGIFIGICCLMERSTRIRP